MAGLKKARRAAAAKQAQAAKQNTPQYQTKVVTPAAPAVSPYVMTTGDKSKP